MATEPSGLCIAERMSASTWIGLRAAPPNRPECRSRSAQVSLHLFVDQPAQRRGDRRRLRVPHAGVADQRQVALELGGIVAHEAEQVFRAALLLALDQHGDVERQLAGHRLEGAAGLDEGHGLAFVVAGAARDDDLAPAVERLDARLERRRLPQIERIDRLHVVMAVEQHARRFAVALPAVAALADHDRMALASGARWSRSRGCAGRPRHVRPPCGSAAHRPGRSTPTGCAAAQTADRGWRRDRGRRDREPPAELRMLSWCHRLPLRRHDSRVDAICDSIVRAAVISIASQRVTSVASLQRSAAFRRARARMADRLDMLLSRGDSNVHYGENLPTVRGWRGDNGRTDRTARRRYRGRPAAARKLSASFSTSWSRKDQPTKCNRSGQAPGAEALMQRPRATAAAAWAA